MNMKKLLVMLCSLLLIIGAAGVAGAATIDFETAPPGALGNYEGFEWDNFFRGDTSMPSGTGLFPDAYSGSYYAFAGFGTTFEASIDRDTSFFIESLQLTSVYHDNNTVEIKAYLGEIQQGSTYTQTVNKGDWVQIDFGHILIDELVFSSPYDTAQYAIDDFTFSEIPIPGAMWLLGSGLLALVGLRRKLKN